MINDRIIVALDFPHKEHALALIDKIGPSLTHVKIGMELYYSEGPELIREIKQRGKKIFLDLKLHDIPNTVTKAAQVLAQLEVDMINLHAAGGLKMMQKATAAYKEIHPEGKVIAVTQLTSTSQDVLNKEILIPGDMEQTVVSYARLSQQAGCDGVVCSALEVPLIKGQTSSDFLCVTPGIRLDKDQTQDQTRVMTPQEAIQNGSDYLVIGRDINQSSDPTKSFNQILKEIS